MCGIVGYIGSQKASQILLTGLKRLEYRGYDSAGISLLEDEKIKILKRRGKVFDLDNNINHDDFNSTIGIAHTRWATHGEPNDINAHPHTDNTGNISLIHNGIIENFSTLKKALSQKGYTFKSDTDTEVLAVFIGAMYEKVHDLELAVRMALSEVDGTFGIIILSSYEPNKLIAARRGSPMVLGIGDDEYILASDAPAIIQHTRQVVYLADNEMAIITRKGFSTKTIFNEATKSKVEMIDYDIEQIEKGIYPHFMLKEIFEQPLTFQDAFRGRLLDKVGNVRLGGLRQVEDKLRTARRIIITACGTSWHAGLVGEYMIENLSQIPVEVEYASEFRYRNTVIFPDDVVIAISQSGETADTLAAVKEAKQKGATVIGIVNSVGSSIARETEAGVYIHAGPEIGVASTKAFTSQVAALALIAIWLGRKTRLSQHDGKLITREMAALPGKIKQIFEQTDKIKAIAKEYCLARNFLYLGRGFNFPVALEGALKLKEISYIHAEGYPAAEMKHGPIALIDENMPVVFIATKDEIYDKIKSNIEEVLSRKGRIIVIATEGDNEIMSNEDPKKRPNHVIYVPHTLPMFTPVLTAVPLQLLAYYIAVELGREIDQPRNLAKSVTVE